MPYWGYELLYTDHIIVFAILFLSTVKHSKTLPLLEDTVTAICACVCDVNAVNDVTASFESPRICFPHSSVSTLGAISNVSTFDVLTLTCRKLCLRSHVQLAIIIKMKKSKREKKKIQKKKRNNPMIVTLNTMCIFKWLKCGRVLSRIQSSIYQKVGSVRSMKSFNFSFKPVSPQKDNKPDFITLTDSR